MGTTNSNTGGRKIGRPAGSRKVGVITKVKACVSIDCDLFAELRQMPNMSAFINAAVRAALHPSAQGADGRE